MNLSVEEFKHESWRSIIGVGVGYAAMLALLLVGLFIIPFLVVWL